MASVFLSYDHEDVGLAAPIAAALEEAGHSVWWDRHIHGGAEYNDVIQEAVERADVVVVLWSERSVRSAWVRDEAAEGRDRGRLIPVAFGTTKPPMGFRQYQTIVMSEPKGRKPTDVRQLLDAIEKVAPATSRGTPKETARPPPAPSASRRLMWWAAGAVALAFAVAALFLLRPASSGAETITAVVRAADPSAPSRDLARDLLAKLGALRSAQSGSLQLLGNEGTAKPHMRFEVGATADARRTSANLVLLDGRSGTLLWSEDFERPADQSGDLRQELAYTAAKVLDCAVDAFGSAQAKLETQVLKLYLNGCAGLAGSSDPVELNSTFRQVIQAAPRFEGAWTNLLVADADAFTASGDAKDAMRLRSDLVAARKVYPKLPQGYLAEINLLPPNAYQQRISLADRAVTLAPDQPAPHLVRSTELFSVGSVTSAVDDARRAIKLDPVSPRVREDYITILADSGRTDTALKELHEAERLWPGASELSWTRFRINMRYGDPRAAWEIMQSGAIPAGWNQAEGFLRARLDRTNANARRAIDDAWQAYRREPVAFAHLVQTLGEFGSVDELLQALDRAPTDQVIEVEGYMFQPMFASFWSDPRSLTYAKRVGLLQYWQKSGNWPDFCFQRTLPYDCKKEAGRLGA